MARVNSVMELLKRSVSLSLRALPAAKWSDRVVGIAEFVSRHRRIPRLSNPKLFNDRLLRLKLDGSLLDPLRQFITDKEYVKYYVASVVGKAYTLETFEILRDGTDVDRFSCTRVPCVIKPTHLSGPVIICTDLDRPINRSLLHQWLSTDYYRSSREVNYKFLRPKIIVEEFFSDERETVPKDYKVFCFHGQPKLIEVDSDRFSDHTRNFYDTAWNMMPLTVKYPAGELPDPKPPQLNTMLEVARKLARPFSSIRVDMYANEDMLKVGELTNCHGGGGELILPAWGERFLGDMFEERGKDRRLEA